jgi:hypothetical protein
MLLDLMVKVSGESKEDAINRIVKSEPFNKYQGLKELLMED